MVRPKNSSQGCDALVAVIRILQAGLLPGLWKCCMSSLKVIHTADQDVAATPVQKRGVGFMFQSFALFKHMTVGENIAFGPRIQKQDINLEARSLL